LFVLRNGRFNRLPLIDKEGTDIGIYLDQILEWDNYFLMIPWSDNLADKLILYDKTTKKVTDIDKNNTFISLAMDAERRIWVGTGDGPRLLDTSALASGKINLVLVPEKIRNIVGNRAGAISFDREDNAWFFDKDVLKITPQLQEQHITAKQGLQVAALTDVFIDREGILWIATDGDGVIKIRNTQVELINSLDQRPAAMSTISIQNDTIWLFDVMGKHICRYSNGRFKFFSLQDKSIQVFNFLLDGQKMYINTGRNFLFIKNKNDERSYDRPEVLNDLNSQYYGLGAGTVDPNGVIIQYVRETNTSFFLYVLKDGKLLMKQPISYFIDQMNFDRQGRLWMATRDNHIVVFTLHPDDLPHYLQPEKDYSKELPSLNPRAMTIDTSDYVWIGTRNNGVYRLQFKDGKFANYKQFTTQNGLTDNFIFTLRCDRNNTIWVGTQTGLDKIFLKDGHFIIGNVSKNNDFYQTVSRIVVTKNNTVWALTTGGIIFKISPGSSLAKADLPPPLLFTSLEVNNQPHTDSSNTFSYRNNNLSFSVAATSFIDEKSIRYSYLLQGSGNNEWSEPLNNARFNFINLSPGSYTLKVRADFPEMVYPPQIISYSFIIKPPWWQTWWFRILIVLFVVGLFILTIRVYYRRKLEKQKVFLEKQQAIEKERTRIATDMHDDLGAGLSRIKFLSETIGIKKQQQLPFEEDISKIREYSHEMIDKMGEIVWALNEKNDSLSDLLSYTRSYTVEYLSQSGVSCTIDSPEDLPAGFVSGEFRRNIFLAVKEILHNIVKHSQADHVSITMQVNHKLCINIHDDGIGFDRTKIRPFSNGLINIEKRMKDIGGFVEMQNTNGTLVKLTAPLG